MEIARHRTAISRSKLSRPLKLAADAGLLAPETTVMDYGCGRGDDVRHLCARGIDAVGWDPVHRPAAPRRQSELVNLGYVLNVIEKPAERAETLRSAWRLAERALIVSALVTVDTRTMAVPYGDGVVTSRGTFQKYFDQRELENYVRSVVGEDPIALGLGVFAVVREASVRANLLASRFKHRSRLPDKVTAEAVFKQNREWLEPLVAFLRERGRLPRKGERSRFEEASKRFGTLTRAFALLRRALPESYWEEAAAAARDDLLVYMALAKFGGRPRFSELDESMQEDVRALFGSYSKAEVEADRLLFSAGDNSQLRAAARGATLGKLLPDAFYVHTSALEALPALLRVYEGCARRYLGGVEGASLVKLSLDSPTLSYLTYPEFERDPHPALTRSLRVDLQTFRVRVDDYSSRDNPPILHRKELLVAEDHPDRGKFVRLTAQEERWGLFDDGTHQIGTRRGWEDRLASAGVKLRGHRLLRDPPVEG